MKGTTIAFAALGLIDIGMIALNRAAYRHGRKLAEAEAIKNRGEEANAVIDAVKKRCEVYDDLIKREKAEFKQNRADWLEANAFNAKKKDILDGVPNGLNEFKKQIGYSDVIQRLTDEYNAGVEAVKNSIDYDVNKAKFEKAIADAKSHYDSQKALYDCAGSDISDDAMKLRHAAEEAMNAKIKEAKANLDILEGKLTTEVEKLTQVKQNGIRELEEKIAKEKIRLDHKADQELEALNAKLAEAECDINDAILNKRTGADAEAEINHADDIRVLREQKEVDAKAAEDIFNAKPQTIKIAEFLKDHKVPKAVVPMFGVVSMAPVGYLSYRWLKFLGQIMRAM